MTKLTLKKPCPVFDSLNYEIVRNKSFTPTYLPKLHHNDYQIARQFLLSYQNNEQTYNAYRREIERFLQWCYCHAQKIFKQLLHEDIDTYIKFCQKPLKSWIGKKKEQRFIAQNQQRIPNPRWRPFVVKLSKADFKKNNECLVENYQLSKKSMQEIFTVLSSFFNYLVDDDYVSKNLIARIRQKNKYYEKKSVQPVIRRLSELQWGYVIETAVIMANENPELHQRTLFIMNVLYGMYLRISELVASERWTPTMGDFARDADGLWWFTTVGKGNKRRQITVSKSMLDALKQWRKYLSLSPLPSPGEQTPLLPKLRGDDGISSSRYIRELVQLCFDRTVSRLKTDKFNEEAEALMHATVHWLRHTGISEDVKTRPREHVRDDAGHSSSAITDKYIDVELRARHQSGHRKAIKPEWVEI